MVAGILAVVVIAAGLPLLAWWVGGRRFWARTPAARLGNVYRDMVLKHHLRPAEIAEVERAVAWGRALSDERLRGVVVEWARALERDTRERQARHPRFRRLGQLLLVLWVVAIMGFVAVRIAHGDLGALVRFAVYAVVLTLPAWRFTRGPRRAIERNSGPVRRP